MNVWAQKRQGKDPSEVEDEEEVVGGVEVLEAEILIRELVAEGVELDVDGSFQGRVRDVSIYVGMHILLP